MFNQEMQHECWSGFGDRYKLQFYLLAIFGHIRATPMTNVAQSYILQTWKKNTMESQKEQKIKILRKKHVDYSET